ncbi:MAG: type I restriction-modification system subunit M [Psychrilyobacter sp.]|uniref:type I restriction-modification system subunit M n=1 Tax=Psychrilyobacter sp. TaxID=2586924 RepID=UPI003C71D843
MGEEQQSVLEKKLWAIANELRGQMGADEFRDYILGFIFYKYLSEKIELFTNEILKEDGVEFENVEDQELIEALQEECIENLGYYVEPKYLFKTLAKHGKVGKFILDDLSHSFSYIEKSTTGHDSEDDFGGLFEEINLGSTKLGATAGKRNELISKVLGHLNEIDFKLEDSQIDVLGNAYEYLISQFASGAGKKAGEFYTPQQVSKILAKLVTQGKDRVKSVYDPTCGSGSLLLRVAKETEVTEFYGQEMNRTTYNLARMNMILHDVKYDNFNIKLEDTLENPQHIDKKFEAVVANPPFSAKWDANDIKLADDRFAQYGKLAPKTKADFAFVQHMIYQLDDNGTMATVLPHGVLFRGAAEGVIRKYLIEKKNYLDAVIGLPANIFYGTSIPTCILIFKKCRENDDILFIDASKNFEKQKNQNILRDSDITKIVETYKNREEIEKFSHRATMEEIAENDYNLNIPRYVDTFEEEEKVDLEKVADEIIKIDEDMKAIDEEIKKYCEELGIKAPMV